MKNSNSSRRPHSARFRIISLKMQNNKLGVSPLLGIRKLTMHRDLKNEISTFDLTIARPQFNDT